MFKKKEVGDSNTNCTTIGGAENAYVSKNLSFVGLIQGQGDIQIDGRVEGDIVIEGNVLISQEAEVYGTVTADNIYIAGVVDGNAKAKESLEIKKTGILTGDAVTKTINIETGGTFLGKCTMSVPEGKESLVTDDSKPQQSDETEVQRFNVFHSIKEIEKMCRQSIRGWSVIRYNAIDGVGGDQSFSAALLDGSKNGLIITSIFNTQESRTYAKPLNNGESSYDLSEEELQAIDLAAQQFE